MPDATPRDLSAQSRPTTVSRLTPDAGPGTEMTLSEVVGSFSDVHAMEAAVQDLLTEHGFDHGDISLLAGEEVVRKRLGHRLDDTLAAADDPQAPRRGYVAPEVRMEGRGALASVLGYLGGVTALGVTFATGGAAGAAILAALVGGGAAAGVGAGLGKLFDQRLAKQFHEQIDHGGILVWVRCREPECQGRAAQVLHAHGAHHVHAHTLAQGKM